MDTEPSVFFFVERQKRRLEIVTPVVKIKWEMSSCDLEFSRKFVKLYKNFTKSIMINAFKLNN